MVDQEHLRRMREAPRKPKEPFFHFRPSSGAPCRYCGEPIPMDCLAAVADARFPSERTRGPICGSCWDRGSKTPI